MSSIKHWLSFMLAVVVGANFAFGQTTTVNQGKPGAYGAWPVSIPGTVTATTVPTTCTNPTHRVTSVGTSAAACPNAQLNGRKVIVMCNSIENSGSPLIKVRIDGVSPVMGTATPGHALAPGDCIQYAVSNATTPLCISDTAGTALETTECQ